MLGMRFWESYGAGNIDHVEAVEWEFILYVRGGFPLPLLNVLKVVQMFFLENPI